MAAELNSGTPTQSKTHLAKWTPSGHTQGQNKAPFHRGIIKAPCALQNLRWRHTLIIWLGGDTSQMFSPCQFWVKASTPSQPGFQKRELNLRHLALYQVADLSTVKGPHRVLIHRKMSGLIPQSLTSVSLLR